MALSTNFRENREFASELKFLVSRSVADQIRHWARACLPPDPHASGEFSDGYQITSLYFDTEQFDVFQRKGSFGRSKYRIRRYGPSEVAFLERKLKTRGLVSKRRSAVKIEELDRLQEREPERGWTGFWYHQRLLARQLKPVCEITYRRTARVSTTNCGPIRLTLDDELHTVPTRGLVFNGSHKGLPLSEHQVILELKYRFEMPALFKQLVEEFALEPQPVSKYRLAVVALGFVPESISNGSAKENLDSPALVIADEPMWSGK